jgi:hypothetical protein
MEVAIQLLFSGASSHKGISVMARPGAMRLSGSISTVGREKQIARDGAGQRFWQVRMGSGGAPPRTNAWRSIRRSHWAL